MSSTAPGQTLLDSADGRAYDADAEVRAATIHLLGDRDGYIPSPLLDHYASRMIGYSRITRRQQRQGRDGPDDNDH